MAVEFFEWQSETNRDMSTDNKFSDDPSLIGDTLARSAANDDQLEDLRPRSPAEALEPARAVEPPERRERRRPHPILIVMNGIMTLLVVGMVGLGALVYFAKISFDEPGPLAHSTIVAIPKGEGVNAIAGRLEREGIIADRRIFVASVIYFKAQQKLKAGEYEVRKGASMRDVLDLLTRGKAILYKVTIPEGLTSEQAVQRLRSAELLVGEINEIPPEGSLMPDTYKFSRGMARQELLERMQGEQRKFVANLWESRAPGLPYKTIEEAIVLASIVEKETGRADERARIAGVFVNRLRKGMRLQSDPTIIYGLVGGKGKLGRPLLREEIRKPTPYNTYVIAGLPPGPIANPGRAAIEAVLQPAATKDIYFVADGTGGHAFAETLTAHNENVARWRQIEREMRAKQAAEAKLKAATDQAAANGAPVAGAADPAATGDQTAPQTAQDLLNTGLPGLSVGGTLEVPSFGLPADSNPILAMPQGAAPSQPAPAAQIPAAPVARAPATPSTSEIPFPVRKPARAQ